MRCSSFELHLDAYVEGSLSVASRTRMDAHVAACPRCAALLDEFRVVDALLRTPRVLDPAPNFTAKIMARVDALPPPRVRRESMPAVLATYIAFGWATIGAFLLWGGAAARATLAALGQAVAHAGSVSASLAGVTARSFGSQAFDVTAAMGGLLGADGLVVAAVVALYAFRRARRTAVTGATEAC